MMTVIGYAVLIAGALWTSCSVMKLVDALENPRKQKKTPTMREHRRGRVNL